MCEVRDPRKRKDPPPTPRMLALLAEMQATDAPVVWDYSRGFHRDTYTLDGRPVYGASVTGLGWRGYVQHARGAEPRTMVYRLTDKGRAS